MSAMFRSAQNYRMRVGDLEFLSRKQNHIFQVNHGRYSINSFSRNTLLGYSLKVPKI
jgi:hypothetical protein